MENNNSQGFFVDFIKEIKESAREIERLNAFISAKSLEGEYNEYFKERKTSSKNMMNGLEEK